MGTPLNFDATQGLTVSRVNIHMVSTAATTYSGGIRANLQFWENFSSGATPIFSTSLGTYTVTIVGLTTVAVNTVYSFDVDFSPPIVFADATNNGVVINYQSDSGSGFADNTNLTSLIQRDGTLPTVGTTPLSGPNYGYYRNASGRTDLNFDSSDFRSLSSPSLLAMILYRSYTVTETPTSTFTPTATFTPTITPSFTPDPTATFTPTITPSFTPDPTATFTPDPTATFTPTITPSFTPDPTATFTSTTIPTSTPSRTNTPPPSTGDTIGVFKGGAWYLRMSNNSGVADLTAYFGAATDSPVVGDWNNDGYDTLGLYRSSEGRFLLSDSNTTPSVSYDFTFGNPGDSPIAGKWDAMTNGSGVGVYRSSNGILYLKRAKSTGFQDYYMVLGNPGDIGIAGDWNGDGFDSVGVYRIATTQWLMSNTNGNGITFSDIDFVWGTGGNPIVAGDWDGNMTSTPGYLTPSGNFVLHPANLAGGVDTVFAFGPTSSLPVAGKWTAHFAPPVSGVIQAGQPPVNGNSDSTD
jgi:hypothetical protein